MWFLGVPSCRFFAHTCACSLELSGPILPGVFGELCDCLAGLQVPATETATVLLPGEAFRAVYRHNKLTAHFNHVRASLMSKDRQRSTTPASDMAPEPLAEVRCFPLKPSPASVYGFDAVDDETAGTELAGVFHCFRV